MTFAQGISDITPKQEIARLRRVVAEMGEDRTNLLEALDAIKSEIGSSFQSENPVGTCEVVHYIARKAIEKFNS